MTPLLTGVFASQISGHLTPAFTPVGSYDAIVGTTSTGASTYTFSGIPSGYKHLQLRINFVVGSDSGAVKIRFNGDTGTNYASHGIFTESVSIRTRGQSSQDNIRFGGVWGSIVSGNPAAYIIDILDYNSPVKNKTIRGFYGLDQSTTNFGELGLTSGLWMNTTPINSITFFSESGVNTTTGFNAALYGVKG